MANNVNFLRAAVEKTPGGAGRILGLSTTAAAGTQRHPGLHVLLALLLLCLSSLALATHAATFPNGYSYSGTITVSHGKVPNTDQTNFPVLISGTYPALASSANGGLVSNPNGFDIIFTSDAAGNNKLNFERVSYSPTTGQIAFWVQLPTLSHSSDTVFYIFYGNPSVTSDPSNRSAVWDSNYVGVWHLADDAASLTVTDSTSNGNNGTAASLTNSKSTPGKLGPALSFNGSSDQISTPASSGKIFTWEAWVNPSSLFASPYESIIGLDGSSYMLMDLEATSGSFWSQDALGGNNLGLTGLNSNTWYHIVFVRSGDNVSNGYAAYLNGAFKSQDPSGTWNSSSHLLFGARSDMSGQNFFGSLSEIRVSNVARSSDWIATEFNNQNSPSSFYSIAWGASSAPVVSSLASTTVNQSSQVTTTPGVLTVSSTSLNFGSLSVGNSSTKTVMLTNSGGSSLTISQLAVSGLGVSATGISAPLSLASGQTTVLSIMFQPAASGTVSGSVSLTNSTSSSLVVINVSGVGVQPQIAVTPTSFSFGNVNVGSVAAHTVTLSNSGTSALTITQSSISGSAYGTTGLTLPLTLAAGQSTSFSVEFTPQSAGNIVGGITFTSNSAVTPSISFSGTGVAQVNYSVVLSWSSSASSVTGYNVYVGSVSGGPYVKLNATPITGTSYTDSSVQPGETYYYIVTSVEGNVESSYSNQVTVAIP